jgi:HEAT repeat protein
MDKRKQVLIDALGDDDTSVRSFAAEALEKMEIRGMLDTLAARIESGEMLEKLRAVYALTDLKGEKIVGLLAKASKDESEDVRAAAIRVLGRTGDYTVLRELVEALGDDSPIVARTAVEAMAGFRDPRLLRPLMQSLKSKDAGVVERALEVVGNLGDKRAEDAMVYFATKGNLKMRELAIKALGEMDA